VQIEVQDVPQESRYEARRDGALLGYAAYQKTDELIVFTHTEVDPALAGQGVGGALVKASLDHVRGLGVHVLPVCPFVSSWMLRDPEYADLDYRRPASVVVD
jgi:predicted GNAT family acetyltransferase